MSARTDLPPREHKPYLAIAKAIGRSLRARRSLPPGDLVHIDRLERGDRTLLLTRAAAYGPVFKGLAENRLLVCVVGLAAGRRLLKEHASSLRPVTLELESLFPKGFLRQMEGESHRQCRLAVVRALNAFDMAGNASGFDELVVRTLEAYRQQGSTDGEAKGGSAQAWSAAMTRIASEMLVSVFFGAASGSVRHQRLMAGYRQLGPHGLVWNITSRQATAFAALRDELRSQAAAPDDVFACGLLGRIAAREPVDDTLLGNLIYMVESGRYDLAGLLRWLSCHAADHPEWLERVAVEGDGSATQGRSVAEAFVQETLRVEKSERLMRNVQRDIVFDGYLIPKGAQLRICMWESHREEAHFPRPFAFDPARFLGPGPPADRFQPFGLDHHHCPFSTFSVRVAAAFLRALARGYRVSAPRVGPAVRGAYHWEPAPGFTVLLQRREATK